jgi:NAD(P)-dependent dehydrogenase (short-subunit alcohol dehydrogenase family)
MDYQKLFRLNGRFAVVVGSGSGIGRASAQGLAAYGAFVLCADISEDAANEAAYSIRESGGAAAPATVNIESTSEVTRLFDDAFERYRRLDVVVVTPGINVRKRVVDYSDEDFDRVLELNLKGTFRVLRAAGKIMSAAGSGSMIAFSSIRSQVVEPGQAVYAATKAGVVQLVRAMAAELGPSGVRVNAIAPGVVETPLTKPIKDHHEWYAAYAAKSVFNRWATSDEMVGPVVYLASDASSYVTGSVLFVDGGWTAADGRFSPPL